MRHLHASIYLTVDGVMEAPQNWSLQYFDEGAARHASDQLFAAGGLLLGRRTYENFAGAWPNRPAGDPFTDRMNELPKYVATRTLDRLEWNNSHRLEGDVAAAVASLKAQPGGDLLIYGSAELTNLLLQHELIDELRLWLHPLILGRGKHLFNGTSDLRRLVLASARPLASGVTILTYTPA